MSAAPELRKLLFRVHALVADNLEFEGERPTGYFQTIGASAKDEEHLQALVRDFVTNDTGGKLVEIDDVVVADLAGRHGSIRDLCGDTDHEGVWYYSGRSFYGPEDE